MKIVENHGLRNYIEEKLSLYWTPEQIRSLDEDDKIIYNCMLKGEMQANEKK